MKTLQRVELVKPFVLSLLDALPHCRLQGGPGVRIEIIPEKSLE